MREKLYENTRGAMSLCSSHFRPPLALLFMSASLRLAHSLTLWSLDCLVVTDSPGGERQTGNNIKDDPEYGQRVDPRVFTAHLAPPVVLLFVLYWKARVRLSKIIESG